MGAGWGVADSLLQFRVPDLGFLEGGNARVSASFQSVRIFVGLVTADTNERRSIPEACARPASTVGFNPFLKRKSRLFIRGSSGFSPVFPQLVEQRGRKTPRECSQPLPPQTLRIESVSRRTND